MKENGIEHLLVRMSMCLVRGQAAMAGTCWEAYINHPQRRPSEYDEPVSYLMLKGDYMKAADVVPYGLIPFLRKLRIV